ncbi:MAG: hypothetical protein QMD61_05040 [Methanobacterium sp.]|nr:hypothetical protein [Methanobacterium sp.]
MKNSVSISIGGIPVKITLDDELFLNEILEKYSNFIVDDIDPTINLEIEVLEDESGHNILLEVPKLTLESEELYKIFWNSFSGEFDIHSMKGKLRCRSQLDLNNYLRIIYSLVLLEEQGFLVHAASLIRNGIGYLFPGKSGTGKTTISRLSNDSILLSDEVSLVKKVDGEYNIFGTPFWGELAIAGENTQAPLKSVFLPKKDQENYITPAKSVKTLEHLIPNVLFFLSDNEFNMQLFNICHDFVNVIPAYELHFLPDPSFWSVINAK